MEEFQGFLGATLHRMADLGIGVSLKKCRPVADASLLSPGVLAAYQFDSPCYQGLSLLARGLPDDPTISVNQGTLPQMRLDSVVFYSKFFP